MVGKGIFAKKQVTDNWNILIEKKNNTEPGR